MSTTSPKFALVIATTADTVSVVDHIANNFTTLDAIVGAEHTAGGVHKASLSLTTPTLINPTISGTVVGPVTATAMTASTGVFTVLTAGSVVATAGTLSGLTSVSATTGSFQTITATGGALTVNSFNIGTCPYPATASAAGTVLTVSGTAAKWVAVTTGANVALSNLGTVAINANLNTFTAGKVTMATITATAGVVSGLTSLAATTGTFQTVTATGGILTGLTTVYAQSLTATAGVLTGISTFQAGTLALTAGPVVTAIGTDTALGASNAILPTENAVKEYVDAQIDTVGGAGGWIFHTQLAWANTATSGNFVTDNNQRYKLEAWLVPQNVGVNSGTAFRFVVDDGATGGYTNVGEAYNSAGRLIASATHTITGGAAAATTGGIMVVATVLVNSNTGEHDVVLTGNSMYYNSAGDAWVSTNIGFNYTVGGERTAFGITCATVMKGSMTVYRLSTS